MIHTERRGSVALITIDRPRRRNALDLDTLEQLLAALRASVDARVLVITGSEGHFCAGADLEGVEDPAFRDLLGRTLRMMVGLDRPLIAAVSGAALGAGTQLAVACDLRVATADATFGIPAARLGLMVDAWTVDRVRTVVGAGPAAALLLAAETLTGADAHRLGLAHRLGGLDDALGWAAEVARLAPLTIAGHKLGLHGAREEVYGTALAAAWASDDLQEGLAAFREGRLPDFEGR